MDPRYLLLGIFGVGWLTVLILTAANNGGNVSIEMWPILGIGIGGILAAFRVDDYARSRRPPEPVPQQPAANPEPPTAA